MLKSALKHLLSEQEIENLSSAFDVIGDIAIIKIPLELKGKEGLIAKEILYRMKNVHTVLNQVSDVTGEFRTRDLVFVGGEERYETIYKESDCRFKVDVRSVYFSPRLSTERARIEALVKDGERIFNMFAGVGSFSIIIARKKRCIIDSVDLNPAAIRLCFESLKLNKKLRGEISPALDDARIFAEKHKKMYDRILMPLPERSREFLSCAVEAAKPERGPVIHYYVHISSEEFEDNDWIGRHLQNMKLGRKFEVATWKRVREVGPRYIQAVADIFLM